MGEMKNCGKTINHYEQDKVFLKFYEQDSDETVNLEYSSESYLKRIFKFLTSFTKKFKS